MGSTPASSRAAPSAWRPVARFFEQSRPGTASVARDHERLLETDDPRRGATERDDELGSEVGVRVAADAVGPEAEHEG